MIKKGRRPQASARHRKNVLEFVKANPGSLAKALIALIGKGHEAGSKRLKQMCDIGELRREPVSVKQENSNRIVRTYQYWAKVAEIFTVEEVEKLLLALAEAGGEKTRVEKEDLPPWLVRNNDPNRMAIPGQGGQGRSQPRCCSAISQLD